MSSIFVHPHGLCESSKVGHGTRIWAFAHVLPGAVIGQNCNICDHVFIENDVTIGNRVTIKCGVQLWDGVQIGDDVFVGPNVTFTNDKFPRSKQYPLTFASTQLADGCSIGANATILPGIKIGYYAMIGAGSVVTHDVPARAIVQGNPARIVGYVTDEQVEITLESNDAPLQRNNQPLNVRGCSLHHLPHHVDMRGELGVAEFAHHLPFLPKRCFWVYHVPSKEVRGEHAHRKCQQFLIALNGSIVVVLDDGIRTTQVTMDNPNTGLLIAPMVWGTQYKYTTDAILLVFASHPYDSQDYIRDYQQFLTMAQHTNS